MNTWALHSHVFIQQGSDLAYTCYLNNLSTKLRTEANSATNQSS